MFIETGHERSLRDIGRDVSIAARAARDTGTPAYLTIDGQAVALIAPTGHDERYDADERHGADGQPLPRGRCDTCGAPCSPDEGACTADPAHQTALTGDEDEDGYEGIDASMAKEDRRNAWQDSEAPDTEPPLTGNESPVAEY
jgi:hypothetical protein